MDWTTLVTFDFLFLDFFFFGFLSEPTRRLRKGRVLQVLGSLLRFSDSALFCGQNGSHGTAFVGFLTTCHGYGKNRLRDDTSCCYRDP